MLERLRLWDTQIVNEHETVQLSSCLFWLPLEIKYWNWRLFWFGTLFNTGGQQSVSYTHAYLAGAV